ncbi:hypothetical protein K437DRAFT_269392 [Tilletiaria anomala UBC 951]|uniref:Zinc metalloprotease n=1 Tax=Tilletiaria anomala (strain ATCC 24038 / CBS 436.72 / UBC 951) TaxID=1037660 RepID=A0A066VUN5_TILAU|nr:uncharacterized protein K437DRAFT_269392 [Tilletiaria anomala UBC 951]KDN42524.1 hypothetical protein K437DRAFT_269392 [Tilletiaria anomala UBC 951]
MTQAQVQQNAAQDGPSAAETQGNFDLIRRVMLDYAPNMSVEKWVSRVTGLTVIWANFESPLLNSYITVASEIFNDSGVPHTLEHLVFLGSEQYPYKGVLDSLANRAFAQGTNAWTSGTETCYTLTTAGSDGFLRMLPVYLDHVFFPTLTDAGFVTEVYHINGKGEDAGVVFSEMQGRENTSGDLMELKTQRLLYPPSSAYRSETGGLMSALRVLSIEEIRQYHQTYYAPHNAALVICGPLDRQALLDAVAPVEQKLVGKHLAFGVRGPPGWKRPFLETSSAVPPTIEAIPGKAAGEENVQADARPNRRDRRTAVVEFPEKDESMGEVEITWLGPTIDEWLQNEAISVLSTYLTENAVSPVQHAFVERDDPYCTDVSFGSADKAGVTTLYAYFSSVPMERLDTLDGELVVLLNKVAEKGIDMDRMKTVIKRDRLKLLSHLETKPADSFADVLIADFLYGKRDGSDLDKAMDDMRRFDILDTWTSEQWVDVLTRYFVDGARLVVIGRPSALLADKLRADTKELVESRKKELGEAGLQKLEEKLELAKKENDKEFPSDMLSRFKIPGVDSIQWISVGTARNLPTAKSPMPPSANISELDRKVQAHVDADGASLPFFVQFDHVTSAFLTVSLIFSTANLSAELRPHITLFLSTLFLLPVTKQDGSGQKLSYEEVIKLLDEDTLEYEASLGVGYGFSENICIDLKVPKENYENAIAWLRDLVWGGEFAVERLRVAAAKLIQSLPEQKRDGRSISAALLRQLTRDVSRSSSAANTVIEQSRSLPEVTQLLADEPDKVVAMFEQIRSTIFRPENMRVSVAGDVLSLKAPRDSFRKNFVTGWQPQDTLPVQWARNVLTPIGKMPFKKGLVCSLPTIESSYAYFTARGIEDYQHPDNAAVVVAVAVLNAMESYLWRFIRGAGLAYGASISSDPESQLISFSLYRSPDSAKAFLEARKVIQALASGEMKLDETTVESAKSSLHFSVADSEGTVGAAASESFIDSVMKGTGKNRGKRLLEETGSVTLPAVREALKKYVLPIFDPDTSICAIASTPSRTQEIADALTAVGYEMETQDLDLGDDGSEEGSGSYTGTSGSECSA